MGKNFVVTGGNGYIGQHMCKYLVSRGENVHIIDNFSTSPDSPQHPYGIFHVADISNRDHIEKIFQSIGPIDGVFHFAAKSCVPEGEEKNLEYYERNVSATIKFLQSCEKFGVENFVFSSSCAVFGAPQGERLNEENQKRPISTYGKTKLIIENILEDLASRKKIRAIVLRYFNAAGADPDGEMGENHEPESHLIPSLCYASNEEGIKFKLYGTDYNTHDGTCVRDYIHVNDLAKAHYQALMVGLSSPENYYHDFNLGSEKGYSVREVVGAFEEILGKKLLVETVSARQGDIPILVADSSKARKCFDFRPSYNLQECIEHCLAWINKKAGHA